MPPNSFAKLQWLIIILYCFRVEMRAGVQIFENMTAQNGYPNVNAAQINLSKHKLHKRDENISVQIEKQRKKYCTGVYISLKRRTYYFWYSEAQTKSRVSCRSHKFIHGHSENETNRETRDERRREYECFICLLYSLLKIGWHVNLISWQKIFGCHRSLFFGNIHRGNGLWNVVWRTGVYRM